MLVHDRRPVYWQTCNFACHQILFALYLWRTYVCIGGDRMRIILHVDLNNFYASVECLYRPELRNLPVAVAGDPENRHGIILAKNMIAKKLGVKTGEAIWEAKLKAPSLVTVSPDFAKYLRFSSLVINVRHETSGKAVPTSIIREDGLVFEIDKVLDIRKAASLK